MPGFIENEAAYEAATRRNIINNARKTFMKRERALDVVNWVHSSRGSFAASLSESLINYGKLTDKQFAAVLRCIDRDAEKKAEWETKRLEAASRSQFVGTVGEKLTLTNVTVEAVLTVDAAQFSYYDRASQEIYLMRDEAGNRIVYRSKADLDVQKGDIVNVTGRVKAHNNFRDENQTLLTRAKFSRVEIH